MIVACYMYSEEHILGGFLTNLKHFFFQENSFENAAANFLPFYS